ncbi:MAG: hypothetical protein AAF989_06210 [Planctomycetota bacterium]
MTHVPADSSRLRRDLEVLSNAGVSSRYRVVACEISRTFTRTTIQIWDALCAWDEWKTPRGQSSNRRSLAPGRKNQQHVAGQDVGDDRAKELWTLAENAGWTRDRSASARRSFSLLAIQFPLFSVAGLASRLATWTNFLFSPMALAIWLTVIGIAAVDAAIHWKMLSQGLGKLPAFLATTSPIVPFAWIVVTKTIHELGHAVMCVRMGSRPGRLGIFLFCGMPCPYCDVTDIWRQADPVHRAAVMLAGIYVELVIASLCWVVWLTSSDPWVQLTALNGWVVCGISTVIFNANPLMRYDGYYVLSDLVGSVNLRKEAGVAFRTFTTNVLSAWGGRSREIDFESRSEAIGSVTTRVRWMAAFHFASLVYRLFVMVAISGMILWAADVLHLKAIGWGVVIVMASSLFVRSGVNAKRFLAGEASWSRIRRGRRYSVMGSAMLMLMFAACVPIPRFRYAHGWMDASDAAMVYVPEQTLVSTVEIRLGDAVELGGPLVQVDDADRKADAIRAHQALRVATLQSKQTSSRGGDPNQRSVQISRAQSRRLAAQKEWEQADAALSDTLVRAPHAGLVVPAKARIEKGNQRESDIQFALTGSGGHRLIDHIGRAIQADTGFARITDGAVIMAVLSIDAEDRAIIDVGTPVSLAVATRPGRTFDATVESVAKADAQSDSMFQKASFQVVCRVNDPDQLDVLSDMGADCKAVFHLPAESLVSQTRAWLSENWTWRLAS